MTNVETIELYVHDTKQNEMKKAELVLSDTAPNDCQSEYLLLKIGNIQFEAIALDFFSALIQLRLDLEKRHLIICCAGAEKNVYPSAMQQDMGGDCAYRLELGQTAKLKNVVHIFDHADAAQCVSVAEQEAFYACWLGVST